MTLAAPSFDIFCQVVDNYGDIGVCWRLAKQLAKHPATGQIRLWVDDMHSFSRIEPGVNTQVSRQLLHNIELQHWTDHTPPVPPHEIVIEAFACTLPAAFIDRMQKHNSLWINLEYLSAETWVEDCHALPSPQANGLKKYFFFPGFTEATGGLLREPELARKRAQWLYQPAPRRRLLQHIGMPEHVIDALLAGWRQVFMFCYGNAPIDALAKALKQSEQPSVLIVPEGIVPKAKSLQSKHLQVFEAPFVDQENFDRLLWSSDLNIVRGEDSILRALWAAKPFLWHIYQQEDNAHLTKLDAWLTLAQLPDSVSHLMRAWNTGDASGVYSHLHHALQPEAWSTWRCDTTQFTQRLTSQTSLVERLLAFSAEKRCSG